jgi:cleavage and polyadenylation specificity factor subunit 3
MTRFKSKLLSLNAQKATPVKVFSPANCEELRIPFRTDKIAKVVGKLAQIHPPLPLHLKNGDEAGNNEANKKIRETESETRGISGVLVQNEFKLSLMAHEDLKEYAGLTTTTIICREHLTLRAAGVELIRWALQAAFGEVLEITKQDEAINGKIEANGHSKDEQEEEADEEISRSTKHFLVMSTVHILLRPQGAITVEWEGNMLNDGIADAVLGVLLSVETSPAAVRQSSLQHSHSHGDGEEKDASGALEKRAEAMKKRELDPKERLSRLFMLLEAQFGNDVTPINTLRKPPQNAGPTPPPDGETPDDDGAKKEEMTDEETQKALERLYNIGIPVPGISINVGGQIVRVWLEDMSVESVTAKSAVLRQRVEMVVREAVECVAPLWG